MKILSVCLLLLCGLISTAPAQTTEAEKLRSLFARDWEWTLQNSPNFASLLGDKRYNNRWDDQSLKAIEERNQHSLETLAELKKIDRAKLSPADRVTLRPFPGQYRNLH